MVQYFPVVTGSLTVTGSINVSGGITASGGISISGSIASASYAATASFVALAQSASNAVSAATASFANAFTVAGNLTAQTLVVQTITSSVDFVTGSTRFGSILSNTHQFTGSVSVSGSIVTVNSISTYSDFNVFQNNNDTTPAQLILGDTSNTRQLLIGYNSGSNYGSIQAVHQGVAYKNLSLNANGGNVGIGTTSPSLALNVIGQIRAGYATNAGVTIGLTPGGIPNNDLSAYILWGDNATFGGENGDLIYVPRTSTTGAHRFYTGAFGAATEKVRITSSGNVGIGVTSPGASLTVANITVGTPSIPSLGNINGYTTAFFSNSNTVYGLLVGSLYNGNTWMQVQRIDGTATAYDLQLQPNGGNVRVGGPIVSTTGQFGTEKTVQINALNTSYLIFSGAPSGIVSARDNTNGGSGLWLLDPNGNGGTATLVAQNWINGAYTVFYSGGNTYVQKTSGNVPVIFHYVIYGN